MVDYDVLSGVRAEHFTYLSGGGGNLPQRVFMAPNQLLKLL